jgi:hypothetical protein
LEGAGVSLNDELDVLMNKINVLEGMCANFCTHRFSFPFVFVLPKPPDAALQSRRESPVVRRCRPARATALQRERSGTETRAILSRTPDRDSERSGWTRPARLGAKLASVARVPDRRRPRTLVDIGVDG